MADRIRVLPRPKEIPTRMTLEPGADHEPVIARCRVVPPIIEAFAAAMRALRTLGDGEFHALPYWTSRG